jgi:hypothetical protein
MSQTSTKKVKSEMDDAHVSSAINDWKAFDQAVIKAQGNILTDPHPSIEVAPEFIKAISGGHDVDSITYGKPGVRVFKEGLREQLLDIESQNNEAYYDYEMKKKHEARRK